MIDNITPSVVMEELTLFSHIP